MIFTAYQGHIVLEIGESVNALGLAWAGKIEINLMRFIDSSEGPQKAFWHSAPQATMHTDGVSCPTVEIQSKFGEVLLGNRAKCLASGRS